MKMFGKGGMEDDNPPAGRKVSKKKPVPGKVKKQISGMADEMASASMPKRSAGGAARFGRRY